VLGEGPRVDLTGRIGDARSAAVVTSYAEARFGIGRVFANLEEDATLPGAWTVHAMAALEALAMMNEGAVALEPGAVALSGVTGNPVASDEVARVLAARLGADTTLDLDITYEAALDPTADLPSPEVCVERLNAIVVEQKLTFAPGSADLDAGAAEVIGKLAEVMRDCAEARIEIGGHTDSQGRESMNLALSQSRAEAVLTALMARRVLTTNMTARGYGPSQPIADNRTEEGREANRRIEFRVLVAEEGAADTDADAGTTPADGEAGADAEGSGDSE
jgi:OOP family OmpA-OmpF porin